MNPERPSIKEIFDRVEQDIGFCHLHSSKRVFSKAIAGCSHLLYGYARNLANNLHPLWAKGSALDDWAKIWLPSGRKSATPAQGTISIESTAPISLAKGTAFRYEGLEFVTRKSQEVSGIKNIPIEASIPGNTGVILPGNQLIAVQTIPNLKSTAIVTQEISGGTNIETDESLRERIINKVRNPPQGGCPQDYINWATEISGISRAWVAPKVNGLGTVGLAFVDDQNGGLPTPSARKKLIEKLEKVAPAGSKTIPIMLKPEPIFFKIKVSPTSVKPQLENELRTLIKSISEPRLSRGYFLNARGQKTHGLLAISDVHESLAPVPKSKFNIMEPSTDLTVSEGKIFTFGGLDVQAY